ncbi:hypothetical protein, partial [Escherichia coli]|uniref:hypothetical protein n=1 Tax=Escherichia coli TaxID=562 RepID=UPI001BD365FE
MVAPLFLVLLVYPLVHLAQYHLVSLKDTKNNFLSFCFAQISIKSRTTNNKKPLTSIDYDGFNLNNRLYNT